LPVVVALYYLLPHKFRWMLIFIASCYFYMVFVPKYILILFFLILIDYVAGITIEKGKGKMRLFYLVVSLAANIGLLAFFKYFNFLNENLSEIFSFFGGTFHPVNLAIILPIGLSFHTFQSMSYTIEVYRGRQKAERHLGYFANYVLFFPQMVAGPIERYDRLGNSLREEHPPLYKNFSDGFKLILFGLFIKMAVADNIAPFVNEVYSDPAKYSSSQVLLAVFLFSMQIYADFFGYSTIALGSAKLLGVTIMDNFNTPYLSRSFNEFWSRWHVSLSSWFRDYVYIPLGGNRVAVPRWGVNIMLVFMISGLWHGASWTFVAWGALHGVMILIERLFSKIFKFGMRPGWSFLNVLLAIKTFVLASFIWIFFRAESFEKAKLMFKALLNNVNVTPFETTVLPAVFFGALMIFIDAFIYNSRFDKLVNSFQTPYRWVVYATIIFCVMALSGTQKFTFIYFQF
jgi:alginate O-acetyltransferase complex protein AlgI